MVQLGGGEGHGKVAVAPTCAGGSDIVDAGRSVIAGMRQTTGSGDPEQGDAFGESALMFGRAEEALSSASPSEGWRGGAASAYTDANRRQADDAASMAVLDRAVQAVIAREANQVGHHRDNLADQSNYLADLSRATGSIALLPGVGTALKSAFELAAVNATLSTCAAEMNQLTQEVSQNVAALQHIAGEYSALTMKSAASTPVGEEPSQKPTDEPAPGPTPDSPVAPAASAEGGPSPATGSPTPEPVAPLPDDDVVGPVAAGPANKDTAQAAPGEAISGISSALGVVGGLIGAVTAPLAAALSGVAGAVGQSLSMLQSAADGTDVTAGEPTPVDDEAREAGNDEFERRPDDDRLSDDVSRDPDTAPSAIATESEVSAPARTDKLDPERSPAATRPPQ